jgi:hypothetical protein
MPVRSFMSARAAAQSCGQRTAIAACFVPTAPYRARPYRRSPVADSEAHASRDWLASTRASTLAWWMPCTAVVAALFVPAPIRTLVWTVALIWMGTACILNARRCDRTHCRFTGPYFLAMIAPVLALGSGITSAGIGIWIALDILILGGSRLTWWATERAWGRFLGRCGM